MGCKNSKISTADSLVLGAIQIMIGIFHVFMWYFLLVLYMGQLKGFFGTYEPLTYKTGCALWGVFFIIGGAFIIKSVKHPTETWIICSLSTNILCVIISIIAATLTIIELINFHSVSYRNFGQAVKTGERSFTYFTHLLPIGVCYCTYILHLPLFTFE
ncbi:membrane-spanning 4-domains subfamily A member 13 [Perognathus longimembris pacificus]|uniref:membrane-spanning 4-domains subfamily A member 13 n=1 Tax=Perognathus longimembris pacificus TaxID=214514 RepID=UPI00201879F9|nr:membrane-spanning 4-domains subfamily A member 13 [Perognathus longimembris pacificus]